MSSAVSTQSTSSTSSPASTAPLGSPPSSVVFVWLDLEMTGLDEAVDCILEVAVVLTHPNLSRIASYHATVQPSPASLLSMSDFVRAMHTNTGLLQRLDTDEAKQAETVERELLDLLSSALPSPSSRLLLCGNSVHVDRRFIRRYWPALERRLHYRIVDVSSWKEVFAHQFDVWYPKRNTHSAVDDVEESISELSFFLSFIDHSKLSEERSRREKEDAAALIPSATPEG